MNQPVDVTLLLQEWCKGDEAALAELMPLVYDELHRLAGCYLRREQANHTIQTTALVHEAFLRLVEQRDVQYQNRSHFFAIAAQMMRRVLVNYAIARQAEKRGGDCFRIALDEANELPAAERDVDIIALDEALNTLTALDERKCRIVELRFFGGLTMEEIAVALDVSLATAKRDWMLARAWLYRELRKDNEHES